MSAACLKCRGILFDMDGVLVDSLASVRRSWRSWAAEFGVSDAATLEIPHGTRAVDIIRLLAPAADAAHALERIDEIELHDVSDIVALPGAAELLRSLPPAQWAIVTSATGLLLRARLKASGLSAPVALVTGSDVVKGKPDPEPYLHGAEKLGFAAADCIVFEDAPSGVRAGKAAGCTVVGVTGTHSEAALWEAGAVAIVASLANVRVVVAGSELEVFV